MGIIDSIGKEFLKLGVLALADTADRVVIQGDSMESKMTFFYKLAVSGFDIEDQNSQRIYRIKQHYKIKKDWVLLHKNREIGRIRINNSLLKMKFGAELIVNGKNYGEIKPAGIGIKGKYVIPGIRCRIEAAKMLSHIYYIYDEKNYILGRFGPGKIEFNDKRYEQIIVLLSLIPEAMNELYLEGNESL